MFLLSSHFANAKTDGSARRNGVRTHPNPSPKFILVLIQSVARVGSAFLRKCALSEERTTLRTQLRYSDDARSSSETNCFPSGGFSFPTARFFVCVSYFPVRYFQKLRPGCLSQSILAFITIRNFF